MGIDKSFEQLASSHHSFPHFQGEDEVTLNVPPKAKLEVNGPPKPSMKVPPPQKKVKVDMGNQVPVPMFGSSQEMKKSPRGRELSQATHEDLSM